MLRDLLGDTSGHERVLDSEKRFFESRKLGSWSWDRVSNRIGRPAEMELTRDMFEWPFDPRKLNRRSGGGVGRVHYIVMVHHVKWR
jgi:hypothetical protein